MRSIVLIGLLAFAALAVAADPAAPTSDSLDDVRKAVADGKAVLVDVREQGEWDAGHLAGAVLALIGLEAVLLNAVDPETIGYFETHGTATQLGDPIEIAALSKVFRKYTDKRNFCAVGSVKTNIGHTDIAAGAAGFIKMALALKHKTIPESLHFETPNPEIDFETSPFYVASKTTEWESHGAPRRAGVSSFGVGGTNANIILEEAPEMAPSSASRQWQLLTLSARSEAALDNATSGLAEHLGKETSINVADVAHTLRVGRRAFDSRRIVLTGNSPAEAVEALQSLPAGRTADGSPVAETPSVAFMFSGQGNQYVQMGLDLYRDEPLFRAEIDRCALLLRPHLDGVDIRDLLYPATDEAAASGKLGQTAFTQPALFVVEYALAQMWMKWGVVPQAMIGHSVGEYVAACLAGVMTLEDALRLIALRGRGAEDRPFKLVNDLRRDSERRYREKEQALTAKLKEVQDQLAKLENTGEGGNLILSEADRQSIEKFRGDMLGIRRELREVKRALREDIEAAGWPIDTVLGSEPELILRYDVSRAILREAVRILEHDGAVRTKRGPGGGLVVSAPDSAAIVRAAGLSLEHDRVTPQQLVDVRSALEVAAVRMTARAASAATAGLVMASVEREIRGGDKAINLYDVHHCIAEASGCRPLALFVRVMSELVARHTEHDAAHGSSLPKIAAETNLAHRRIAEAIAEGDADLAEKRMRRHLSAALAVMR